MVARNTLPTFYQNCRCRLLVGFLAWKASQQRHHRHQGRGKSDRFFATGDEVTFVAFRDDKPGGAVIEDADGCDWYAPVDYLERI